MLTLLVWCVVLFFCWPLALVALVMYPLIWLLLLPFRIVGIAVGGALELVWAVVTLPARVLRRV
ncbi:MAG: hypothetical protein ABSC93_12885 [Bryobacteraceae bacterium]